MVNVSFDTESGSVMFRPSGNDFHETVECLKENHVSYEPGTKLWKLSAGRYSEVRDELRGMGIEVSESVLMQGQYSAWLSGLSELTVYPDRRHFVPSLMRFPFLVGKHPNEDFQSDDFRRAVQQNRFLFNWEMGCGKSYMLAALIEHLRYYGDIDRALVCTTGIGVKNLKSELIKFGVNQNDSDIFVLTSVDQFKKYDDRDIFSKGYRTIIATYDAMKSISDYYYDKVYATKGCQHPSRSNYRAYKIPVEQWLGGKNGGLFLDENHSISWPDTKRSKLFIWIKRFFKSIYLFTGTLADKNEKMYMPCLMLDRALVSGLSYSDWLREYNEVGTFWSKWAVNPDKWNLEKFGELNKALIRRYASKRLASECLDIPPDYVVPTIYTELGDLQKKIYQEFTKWLMAETQKRNESDGGSRQNVLLICQMIHMSLDNPEVIAASQTFPRLPPAIQTLVSKYAYARDNAKLGIYRQIVEDRIDAGQRGIIWYYHPLTGQALMEAFSKYKPYFFSEALEKDSRFAYIEKFKASGSPLIIASINCMNSSITLTECSYEIYAEKTYNYTVYKQSQGRIRRTGQKEQTRTYSVRFSNTLDNVQEENLNTKGALLNAILNKRYVSQNVWKKMFNFQQGTKFEEDS